MATSVAITHLSDHLLAQSQGGQEDSFWISQKPQLLPLLSAEGAVAAALRDLEAGSLLAEVTASGFVGLGMDGTQGTQERKAWRYVELVHAGGPTPFVLHGWSCLGLWGEGPQGGVASPSPRGTQKWAHTHIHTSKTSYKGEIKTWFK